MKIETKYSIGDKVWVMNYNEPTEFVVCDIEIFIHTEVPQGIWYSDEDGIGWLEEQVYSTKEELLKEIL